MQVASVFTLVRRLGNIGAFDLGVIDECHHSAKTSRGGAVAIQSQSGISTCASGTARSIRSSVSPVGSPDWGTCRAAPHAVQCIAASALNAPHCSHWRAAVSGRSALPPESEGVAASLLARLSGALSVLDKPPATYGPARPKR